MIRRSAISWLAWSWNRLFGSKKLPPYEQLVLDAWRASLPPQSQHLLDGQLQAVSFVQHQAGGAKVCFYYRRARGLPLFKHDQPDLHVATILLQAQGVETLRAKIFIHRGKFFSIEFPKRPSRYMQQHDMKERALRVVGVKNHATID